MAESTAQESSTKLEKSNASNMVVVEINKKQKRKSIRQLHKGRGKLFERINEVVDDLREEGAIGDNAAPVVIIVREKQRNRRFRF